MNLVRGQPRITSLCSLTQFFSSSSTSAAVVHGAHTHKQTNIHTLLNNSTLTRKPLGPLVPAGPVAPGGP